MYIWNIDMMLLKPGNNPLVSCVVVINTIDYDNPILSNLIHCKVPMSTILFSCEGNSRTRRPN